MKVAVLDDYQHVALDFADWSTLDAQVEIFHEPIPNPAQTLQVFDVIVAMRERTPFRATLLRQLSRLRLLVTTGSANASIDLEAAASLGITVSTTRRGSSTTELTWALILAAVKGIPREHESMRRGGWQTGVGGDLAGRTLGIIGLGDLGSKVARIGQAFGMEAIAWSQNLTPQRAQAHGVRAVAKQELLATSDVLSIHLILSERTRGIIGRPELAAMKRTALFVNTSRGPLVDEHALLTALRERWIAGAALDVYDQEPLPAGHPLRLLDNVVLTPHIGYVSRDTYATFYRDAVEDIAAWQAGRPIRKLMA